MTSTSKKFLQLVVEPTVKEFANAPYDIRRGLLAALVLNHMTDHFAMENCHSANRNEMGSFLEKVKVEMRATCQEFQFIQDVADATKHAKLSVPKNPNTPARDPQNFEQMSSTPGFFNAPFGEGVFAEGMVVFATLADGSTKPLLPAIKSVLNTWYSFLGTSRPPTV